ncbi:MAG: DUF4175 domain-containing protein [bacterium]|nr:DUF4175 domain-containing protein [bacterium]
MSSEPSTATPSSPDEARQTFARAIEPLLGRQLDRLRRRYLFHGLGYVLLLPALAIGLFFALDHSLRLPVAVRLLHTAAVLAIAGYAIARFVVYPLSQRFSTLDVAQALERAFPELHQRLVSAVQLQQRGDVDLRNQSSAMIDRVVTEAAAAANQLPFERFFDGRRIRRVGGAATVAIAALLTGAVMAPTTARTFLLRQLGFHAEYPRQTYLSVQLPAESAKLHRVDTDGNADGVAELLLPAGGELHVVVSVNGVVPKEVFLDLTSLRSDESGNDRRTGRRSVPMTPRPNDRFRHVFRKLSGAFEFHARGGDDENGDLIVRVRTVRPPQVATIRANITPPAYTGVDQVEQTGGAVEALIGSEVELFVTTTAAVQSATMAFLESGRRLDLEPTTIQDDSGATQALRTRFVVQGPDRYQIELRGGNDLENPDPGTYPISALKDYAPVGRWLLPGSGATLLVKDALLCVRTEVRDDFGLERVTLRIDRAGDTVREAELLTAPANGDRARPKNAVVTELFEVKDLLGSTGGDGLSLALQVTDNRAPEAGTVELPRRIVQIVDGQQLAEAITKSFRRLREETTQALDIQIDRRLRLQELAEQENVSNVEFAQTLSAVEVGQSRVLSSCERLHDGLMNAFDIHLWNRLDPSPNALLAVDLYRAFSATLAEPLARAPEFYRDLIARRKAGTLGGMETALDPILQMIALADDLATTKVPAAARTLAEAQVAVASERAGLLERAQTEQQQIALTLQQLLDRLEEWNDYQDTVQEARALRDRQRDLQMRTEELRGKK